jgi:hypothetical protein
VDQHPQTPVVLGVLLGPQGLDSDGGDGRRQCDQADPRRFSRGRAMSAA